MTKTRILPIILAGGSGERLWPLSRSTHPKQFLNLLDAKVSLFQATLQRLNHLELCLPPLIVCHEDHRFLVAEQLRELAIIPSGILLEPTAKNTAPAIALAAHWANTKFADTALLVLPADHFIPDHDAFMSTVEQALEIVALGKIVTFGIPVTRAESGYGYIQLGAEIAPQAYNIDKFIEKPNQATAHTLMNDGYLWNSGIFFFTPTAYLQELQQHASDIANATQQAIDTCKTDADFIRPNISAYQQCPNISIDYAVMEKTYNAMVFRLPCAWSDVGSWQSVWEHSSKDQNNNALSGDVVIQNSKNCLINAQHRLVTALDVDDLAIIETSDAILVTKKDNNYALKNLVATLKQQGHLAATTNKQVARPWGYYDSLIQGPRFQVKILVIDPGKNISLQEHQHRSEHWVVVKGCAQVVRGDETFILNENESTFIPLGVRHQLRNFGKIPLEIIEVQSGSYLGEDDIVRYEEEVYVPSN